MSRPILLAAVLLAATPAVAGAAGPRAASATVCGDQYLLALADPGQIAALSPQAGDRWLSLLADEAAGHPRLRPAAESYVAAGVEVVLADAWSDHKTMALLERFGIRVVRIPLVESFGEVETTTRMVAEALGHPGRGEALNAATRARLAVLRAQAAGAGREALYLRPGGGSAAAGTFVDAVMQANGLANRATADGRRGWTGYDLEQFVMAPPDLLLTSFFDSPDRSLRRAFGAHPAFTARAAATPSVEVPGRTWICSGWILVEAAEALAQGLRRLPALHE
ncbi:ABC transporter substrate-binding protein [Azospirillum picis]|uniref:Iron complex transport system substrate-binding protein n=1 Tax=Azospirillum picis TaxID=488438 RepID=A0ABU0MI88_9PROT|nr:ABC transporter substrate-binding protein [Azospirillum picis]MBP2299273.1 iron complex transport system substrate-binding protein [Azospirillum picis]MDQ0533089.1 iron complex transport system substrate-binding protein [Azospirillum picis]